MRFHCGISFSWRSIKRFLFPILIGLLAFFGFNFIYEHNTPLGFFTVNALENYDSEYDISYTNYDDFINYYTLDSNGTTLKNFLDSIISLDRIKNIVITFNVSNTNKINIINIYTFDNNSVNLSFFGNSSALKFRLVAYNGISFSSSDLSNLVDIYSSEKYNSVISCLNGNNCSAFSLSNYSLISSVSSLNNSDNFNLLKSVSDYTIYYSDIPIYLSNDYQTTSSSYFYKKTYINNHLYSIGDKFPTYLDLFSSSPSPDDPDEPSEDTTEHKALFNKIYWFDDNSTEYGVLTSIYELLFLYCLTMIIFRILTYIKNTRW